MERTKARKARFMSHFLKFTGKIILVFVCAGGIGAALLGNGWGIPLGIVALVAVSWGGTKLGQQLRNQKLKRIAEPTVLKTKDGKIFRVTSNAGEKETPASSNLDIAQVMAEKWELTS